MKIKLLFSILFFLSGCFGPGINDYSKQLTSTGTLTRCNLGSFSSHNLIISCSDKSKGFQTEPKVYEYWYSDSFIVAKTHPVTILRYPENPNSDYKIPDESQTKYWFLNLLDNKIEGPINESQEIEEKYRETISKYQLIIGNFNEGF